MFHHPLLITILAVTVVYLLVLGILFWQFRISMRQLGKKMLECQEEEQIRKENAIRQQALLDGKHSEVIFKRAMPDTPLGTPNKVENIAYSLADEEKPPAKKVSSQTQT